MTVGEELRVEDSGSLTVTSRRVIFRGKKKTIEITFPKLVGMNIFENGLQFHISNRQTAPFFTLEPGILECVAATINATTQDR